MANLQVRAVRTVWKEWPDARVSHNFLVEAAQRGGPTTPACKQMCKDCERIRNQGTAATLQILGYEQHPWIVSMAVTVRQLGRQRQQSAGWGKQRGSLLQEDQQQKES